MGNDPAVKIERMHRLNGAGATKAFCDIVLMDTFVVKGLRVVEGKDGLFLSMPSGQARDGKWYETFYPVSRELRDALQSLILEHYENED